MNKDIIIEWDDLTRTTLYDILQGSLMALTLSGLRLSYDDERCKSIEKIKQLCNFSGEITLKGNDI